jgi:hypothetical protein
MYYKKWKTLTLTLFTLLIFTNNYSQPIWSWNKHYGGNKNEYTACVKTDINGNVYMAGTFESSSLTIGTNVLNIKAHSQVDIFLSKLDINGNVLWTKSSGAHNLGADCNNSFNYVTCMAIDNNGNCYIAGMFESDTLVFSPTIQLTKLCESGDADIFIAKYDINGNVIWAEKFGGTNWDKASDMCIDNSGNIIITGTFWSSGINFGTFLLNNTTGTNAFVTKLNSNGNVIWARGSSGNVGNDGICLAVDNSNNVIIGGNFSSNTISFGSQTLTNTGMWDLFLVKYDLNGNVIWANSGVGNKTDNLFSLKTDNTGNIYFTGRFLSSQITFGSLNPIANTSLGDFYDIFIAKYNSNGNAIWAKGFGGEKEENSLSMTIDNVGNLLICGQFESDVATFDSYNLYKSGSRNMFITKIDQNSNVLWAISSAGNNNDNFSCMTSDNVGNNYILGSFFNAFSLGSCNLNSNGLSDVYLIKFQ